MDDVAFACGLVRSIVWSKSRAIKPGCFRYVRTERVVSSTISSVMLQLVLVCDT